MLLSLLPISNLYILQELNMCFSGAPWVVQLVECPALDFSLGHDFGVVGLAPWSAWNQLVPLLLLPPLSRALSLSNK